MCAFSPRFPCRRNGTSTGIHKGRRFPERPVPCFIYGIGRWWIGTRYKGFCESTRAREWEIFQVFGESSDKSMTSGVQSMGISSAWISKGSNKKGARRWWHRRAPICEGPIGEKG